MGPYDWHYDYDKDGKLDSFEEYCRQDELDRMAKIGIYEENEKGEKDLLDDELELAGLSRDELALMDDEERAEALEEADIDPDDWDDI